MNTHPSPPKREVHPAVEGMEAAIDANTPNTPEMGYKFTCLICKYPFSVLTHRIEVISSDIRQAQCPRCGGNALNTVILDSM